MINSRRRALAIGHLSLAYIGVIHPYVGSKANETEISTTLYLESESVRGIYFTYLLHSIGGSASRWIICNMLHIVVVVNWYLLT